MFGNPDYYNIEKLTEQGLWPYSFLSAYGMIPYLKRAGDDLIGIEIGVLKGENIYMLLDQLPNVKKIIGIDNYEAHTDYDTVRTVEDMKNYEEVAKENLERFGERYSIIKEKSSDAAILFEPETIDFILIDGDHSYDGVKADLTAYYPLLKKRGHMFIHDTFSQDVFNAVSDYRNENKLRMPLNKSKNYVDFWVKP